MVPDEAKSVGCNSVYSVLLSVDDINYYVWTEGELGLQRQTALLDALGLASVLFIVFFIGVPQRIHPRGWCD